MRYTRISTYEMTNGTFDELTGIVEKGILPTFANLPGFENFGLVGRLTAGGDARLPLWSHDPAPSHRKELVLCLGLELDPGHP